MRVYAFVLLLFGLACVNQSHGAPKWSDGLVDRMTNASHSVSRRVHAYYDNVVGYIEDGSERITARLAGYIKRAKDTGRRLVDTVKSERGTRSEECPKHSPEWYMSTPQLLALHGYPSESHTLRTVDGYLLTVHRVPRSIPDVVILHHGLLGSSADWVVAGPQHSLAYFLADAGYDVWMANARGNTYSRAHVKLDPSDHSFWNYTWHDIAQRDLPALINHIHDVKGPGARVNYVGHSMGTTILFSFLSTQPEYASKLRAGFVLAPVAFMSQIRSPVRLLAPYSRNLAFLLRLLGADEFLPANRVLRWLTEYACDMTGVEEALCENSLFVLCGHDSSQFNKTLLPMILGHIPAGASVKTLIHYAQEISDGGRFQQFDYGHEGNIAEYGSPHPPAYNLSEVRLPLALLSAQNDWLAGEKDVKRLSEILPHVLENYLVPLPQFNHIDFLWAVDAPRLVYKPLLEMIARPIGDNTKTIEIREITTNTV